ncbi:hypothetical protein P7K49_018779 [Saguinus oedipus]|uniref:BAH domain-containing protein n=1 Tax=Saguinus oedipus TaxID=9490 RepID=A0ABQ9V6D0_SAGOE|nr:hypothetical protein P7K49_018779 [Saguinus oedipus]
MENPEMVDLPEKLKHQLRHRELFLSRQLESLPATHIRGKCSVTLLNETESLKSYLEREDPDGHSVDFWPKLNETESLKSYLEREVRPSSCQSLAKFRPKLGPELPVWPRSPFLPHSLETGMKGDSGSAGAVVVPQALAQSHEKAGPGWGS